MPPKKTIVILVATGAQGGGLAHAILELQSFDTWLAENSKRIPLD